MEQYLKLTKLCQVWCRIESEMLAAAFLELLVFRNKSQVFLLVQFFPLLDIIAFRQYHFFLKIFLHPFVHFLVQLSHSLVFFSKSIVPFRIHDFIFPFDTSIDPFTCGVAIEALS